jgi:hypothetical protein
MKIDGAFIRNRKKDKILGLSMDGKSDQSPVFSEIMTREVN